MDRKRTDGEDSKLPSWCALQPVDLKLTLTDCSPEKPLVHFQGQYTTTCKLDYNILQVEIQNVTKTNASVEVGDTCLVEDLLSSQWYRARVQKKSEKENLFHVFLLDDGNILTVGANNLSAIPDSLLVLPPKIVCGIIANVLPFQEHWDQPSEAYFSSLTGKQIEGYINGFLLHNDLILEVPEIAKDLLRLRLGRHVDTGTFLLLVELELGIPTQHSSKSVPALLIEKKTALENSFDASNLYGYKKILSLGGSKLAVGQREKVRIASAVNPGLLYCQLASDVKELKEMSEELALVCELKNEEQREKLEDIMGLLCAVKGKDEQWYRGLVQCLSVNSQVSVVFVDYGYCESVQVENIFQLPLGFLLSPVMAFPCSLSCLEDKDTVNHQQQQQQQLGLLRKGLLGTEFVITVNDVRKEKGLCLVSLGSTDQCAPFKTVQCEEDNKMIGCGTFNNVHQLSYIANETKTMKIPKRASEDMQDNTVFEGYIEHVQSPHDFWMRSTKFNDQFDAMMNKLADWFNRLELNEEILQNPAPGQLCCAMYEKDMHYYRAVVVDVLKHGAEVFFIDFGNTEKVPSMLIKKIPTEFAVEPVFAFNCSLAHVVPLEDEWTTAATDLFRKATSGKAIQVHVLYRRGEVLVVEMSEKRQSIASLLTSANMAIYWTYSVVKPRDTPVGKNNRIHNRTGRKHCADKSMLEKLPSKVTRLEINKCADKQDQTVCEKLNEIENFKAHTFKPGTVISVRCSHINSLSDFWCQNLKNKSSLDRLMVELQRFYQTNTSVLQPQSLCCAVKLHADNMWYRGCIFEDADLTVKVILVDCGIVVQENLQNLRALNPEFLRLEGQAFRCSLSNLTNLDGGNVWSDKANALLKDFTSGRSEIKCRIYAQVYEANKGFYNTVDLYTPFQQASTYLIESGVAKEMQHPKRILPSVYPCSFVYSSFGITVASEELVFPTFVVSPWEIYIQLDRNTEIIQQLLDRTMEVSEEWSKKHGFPCAWPSVCLAKYSEDGMWYRSFVWPAKSSLHVNVFYVDYGGRGVAEKHNLLSIPIKAADLLLTPMQALRCSLFDVPEEEHLPEVNLWLEKAILNKGLQAKFTATNSSGHFVCDLFDGDLHINKNIREIFAIHRKNDESVSKPISSHSKVSSADKKFWSSWSLSVEKLQMTSSHSTVMKVNGKSSQKNLSKVKSSQRSHNLCAISTKNNIINDNRSLQPTNRKVTGTNTKVQPCRLPNVSDLPAVAIAPGYRGIGFISHCASVKSFFIQMEKDEQIILKMRADLNGSPSAKHLQSVASNIKVGHLVAVRYDQDLALYRAAVQDVASNGFVTVEFIDYGNTATVDKKKLHPLASKFLSRARLSTHCTLTKQRTRDHAETLISSADDRPLMVEFVQNLGHAWEVNIQRVDPWHESKNSDPAQGIKPNLKSSDGKEPIKKQCAAAVEDYASVTSVCKTAEAEITSINKRKKRHGIQVKKLKALKNVQAEQATGFIHKSDTEKQEFCLNDRPQKPETERIVTKNKSSHISEKPPTAIISPEKPMNKDNGIRRLFFSPVQQDHKYSGFSAAVTTPGKFYVVLEDLFLIMFAVFNVLEDLPEDLVPLPSAHLIPGSSCLVKSEEKKKWCRAEIIHCDSETVMVDLVDYGYCLNLALQDACKLKVLPVQLAEIPKMVYPCLLRGVKPAKGLQWSEQSILFFQQCMYQKHLKLYFRQCVSEAQWGVDIITSNNNMAKDLVDAGHAQYIDNVLGIRFHQGPGRRKEIDWNSEENGYHDVTMTFKQTQSKMEDVQQEGSEHNKEYSGDWRREEEKSEMSLTGH